MKTVSGLGLGLGLGKLPATHFQPSTHFNFNFNLNQKPTFLPSHLSLSAQSNIQNPKSKIPYPSHLSLSAQSKSPRVSGQPPIRGAGNQDGRGQVGGGQIQNPKSKILAPLTPLPLNPLTPKTSPRGFALVATLMMIAVITGAAVAFFQSTRIERFVSRNYADLARAQLAAESGYALAAGLLRLTTTNDHFLVVQNPASRQLFIGNGSNQPVGTFLYQPLYSFASAPSNLVLTNYPSAGQPLYNAAAPTVVFTNNLPGGVTATSPAVSWVNLTNASGQTNARFAFWIEDLGGRLDLGVAGSTGTNAARPTGTNPAELALWSIFNPAAEADTNNVVVNSLTNNRRALLTPATARLVNASITPAMLSDLATGLIQDTNEPEIIPYGFGYADAGKLKVDLNSAPAITLVDTISNNLPNFQVRRGNLAATNYLNQIAANIVDYRDPDSVPTRLGSATGIDSYPFITEVTVLYTLTQTTGSGTNFAVVLNREPFVELWNSTDQPFVGNLQITVTCNENLRDALGQPRPFTSSSTLNTNYTLTNPVNPIPAGAYLAVALPSNAVTVTVGDLPTNRVGWMTNNSGGFFSLSVSGAQTQTNMGKLVRRENNIFGLSGDALPTDDPSHVIYRGQIRCPPSADVHVLGDLRGYQLRSATLNTMALAAFENAIGPWPTYSSHYGAQSSFGGRNSGNSWTGLMEPVRDTPQGANPGNSVAGIKTKPTAVPAQPSDSNNVLQKIRNSNLVSATELGRIFDPGFWDWTSGAADIPTNATASLNRGGGNTLRIGRKEHPKFDIDGQRAHQLLDLFAASTNASGPGGSVVMQIPGKINLNTASASVFRALAAGVTHRNDPGQKPDGAKLVVSTNAVDLFVNALTEARANGPFFSPSQLSNLTNSAGIRLFGNATILGVTDWNDAAAEEWFSRIYHLSSVRSRNFLIHVVGQAMRTNQGDVPLASSRLAVQVYASPQRSTTDGLTTNVQIMTLNRWSF